MAVTTALRFCTAHPCVDSDIKMRRMIYRTIISQYRDFCRAIVQKSFKVAAATSKAARANNAKRRDFLVWELRPTIDAEVQRISLDHCLHRAHNFPLADDSPDLCYFKLTLNNHARCSSHFPNSTWFFSTSVYTALQSLHSYMPSMSIGSLWFGYWNGSNSISPRHMTICFM